MGRHKKIDSERDAAAEAPAEHARRLGRFKRRQGRRLQRSVETLAVLSEIEQREEDFDVSFSLDELGETSERVCATFHASVNLGHIKGKGYQRCKGKSLSDSFAASSTEPLVWKPRLLSISPLTDDMTTTLSIASSMSFGELTPEDKEYFLPDPEINLSPAMSAVDVHSKDELVPQGRASAVYRRICRSSFRRVRAQPMAVVRSDFGGVRKMKDKLKGLYF